MRNPLLYMDMDMKMDMKMYRTITIKLNRTEQLDSLARECGRIYSKTLSYIHKIHRKKGIWLTSTQMQKIIKSDKLHSQTTQAVIQKYFASLKSYFGNKKINPKAKPPLRRHKFFCIPFKSSAIHLELLEHLKLEVDANGGKSGKSENSGKIILSCGKGVSPVVIPLPKNKALPPEQKPKLAEIVWDGEDGYYLKLTVEKKKKKEEEAAPKVMAMAVDPMAMTHPTPTPTPPTPITPITPITSMNERIIAVDPGEIHPITAFRSRSTNDEGNGGNGRRGVGVGVGIGVGIIYNGRFLRSQLQYREKVKASFQIKLSKKKRGSHRGQKLLKAKRKKLKKLNNRIKDCVHKITRHFVETAKSEKVSMVVYGDTTHIRQKLNYGKKVNQKLHQWLFNKVRVQVNYKLAEYGIGFALVNERGTSHTCPVPTCGAKVNPDGRNFRCRCGFSSHRDLVGAINILSKYQGYPVPVVAVMAPASGIRFNWNLCCSARTRLRIPRL